MTNLQPPSAPPRHRHRLRPRVLLLPGWLDSGPTHWQSQWAQRHGDERVEQADWVWPRRGDWMARLDDVLLADPRPALLAAHSLGCHLVAGWAAHSAHTARVLGALLVAPPDLDRADTPPQLFNWRPMRRQRLPFPARVVYSTDDPFATPAATCALAADWGATLTDAGARGHLNGDSGLGDWAAGRAMLLDLALGSGADDVPPASAPRLD